jgi:hypothetical protein
VIGAAVLVVSVLAFAGAALAALVAAQRGARADADARRVAEVAAAEVRGELAIAEAALETTERLRLAEKARADVLEEELADADRASIADHPDPGARRRVLARWREANAAAAAVAGGGDAGPVSDPAATGPASVPGRDGG